MACAGARAYKGVRGLCFSGVQGQSPWSEGQGAKRKFSHITDVTVIPLSTVAVGYTSVAAARECYPQESGITNLIHDRHSCSLFALVCGHYSTGDFSSVKHA